MHYLYNIKKPTEVQPKDLEKSSNGSLIKWNMKDYDKEEIISHQYRLVELYKFEELKIFVRKTSNHALGWINERKTKDAAQDYMKILTSLNEYG